MSTSPSSSVSVFGWDVSGDGRKVLRWWARTVPWFVFPVWACGVAACEGSHTAAATTVPLRSRPGTSTVPVGVPLRTGVALVEVSVEVSASESGLELAGNDVVVEEGSS